MRSSRLTLAGAGVVLVALVAADLSLAYASSGGLLSQRDHLSALIAKDRNQGLPVAQARELARQLRAVDVSSWWAPGFNFSGQKRALGRIRARAGHLFTVALVRERSRARAVLTGYQKYLSANSAWLSGQVNLSGLRSQVSSAPTPGALLAFLAQLETKMAQTKSEVDAAQAKAAASVKLAQAPGGLLQQAAQLEAIARADNLSPLNLPQLAAALRSALASGAPATAQGQALGVAITALRAEIGLNNQIVAQSRTVMGLVDQAGAEQTPQWSTQVSQYQASQKAFHAARTDSQLAAVQATLNSVQAAVSASLGAHVCGHTGISGKSIRISLTFQEMVFFDNGCAVRATPVTTGRPQLRTPTGTFHIFDKQSPYVFISPWPPGSPFWYPTSPVSYVMEFDQGGYYIHDAPWEATNQFGPGSENLLDAASHGCVHTPESFMAWAYSWTPMGTPVVIVS